MKHARGWNYLHDADGDFVIFDDDRIVAISDADTEWDERNVKLMTAAPEMYAALKLVEACGFELNNPANIDVVVGAISKAEGRP